MNMWNKIFYTLLCLLLFISCREVRIFEIVGEVPNKYALDGSWVRLSFDEGTAVDSARVERGRFYFQGEYQDTMNLRAAYLTFESGTSEPVIIEPGTINLRVPKYAVGTPLNEAFTRFRESLDSVRGTHHERLYALKEQGIDYDSGEKILDSLFKAMQRDLAMVSLNFIEHHTEDISGGLAFAEMLRSTSSMLSIEEVRGVADKMRPIIDKNRTIKKQFDRFVNRANTGPGKLFVDFQGVDLNNQPVSLSDYVGKGRYILLDFWASWCSFCRKIFPDLLRLQASYDPAKFQIVGVFVWDSPEHLKEEYNTSPTAFPLIIDEKDESTFIYGIPYLPEFILFDPEGNILKRGLLDEEMKTLIHDLLTKK